MIGAIAALFALMVTCLASSNDDDDDALLWRICLSRMYDIHNTQKSSRPAQIVITSY
jgi:hypothetical protein